ncbi:MAG TPA: BON domain-containing protein [Candidatus Limnocylindrales bacterium]
MRESDIQRRDQSREMTQQRAGEQGEWQGYVQPYRYYGPGYRGVGYYAVFYQGPDGTAGMDQVDDESTTQGTQFDQRNVQYGQGQRSGWGWQGRGHARGSWERSGAWGDRARQFGQFAGRGPKGYQRSDERIREDVSDRLMEHPELDASGIEVHVKDAVVTLKGEVDSRWAKRLAEDIAEEVGGIRDVMNHLGVGYGYVEQGSDAGRGRMTSGSRGTTSGTRGTSEATAPADQPRNGRRSSTATAER